MEVKDPTKKNGTYGGPISTHSGWDRREKKKKPDAPEKNDDRAVIFSLTHPPPLYIIASVDYFIRLSSL